MSTASDQGRLALTDFTSNIFTGAYPFWIAIIGGAFLSMASHGADQLIVPREFAGRCGWAHQQQSDRVVLHLRCRREYP